MNRIAFILNVDYLPGSLGVGQALELTVATDKKVEELLAKSEALKKQSRHLDIEGVKLHKRLIEMERKSAEIFKRAGRLADR